MPADGSVRLFVNVEVLDLSISDLENIPSIVIFYGTRPGDYSSSKAAYLGHYAETNVNVYVVSAHLLQ